MEGNLDYAHPIARQPARWLALFAHLTLAYPLFFVSCLFGEWFLAWYVLGRQPLWDDPKSISGSSWMHPITAVALLGVLPAAWAALVFNAAYVDERRLRGGRLAVHALCLLGLWLGMMALLRWYPYPVLEWWLD